MKMGNILVLKNFTTAKTTNKVALFDLDDTLIRYQPYNCTVNLTYPNIKAKLHQLHEQNYFIAILSNQLGILDIPVNKERFVNKIEKFFEMTNVPILFIAALERDIYRKPGPGMLNAVRRYVNDINFNKSFYVGDAAGRLQDHSDCDLKLSLNLGVKFMTPEMFFDAKEKDFTVRMLDMLKYNKKVTIIESDKIFIYGKGKTSGKHFFIQKYFSNYNIIGPGEKIRRKSIFVNCKDEELIKKYEDSVCYYLDYPDDVVRWLKIFSELTGKKSRGGNKKDIFEKYRDMFKTVVEVGFCYESSGFTEEERTIAKLAI